MRPARSRRGPGPRLGWLAALVLVTTTLVTMDAAARGGNKHEATAGDRETARSLMDEGDRKAKAGDYRAALDAYVAADKIMRVPTTAIEVGRAQDKLGLLLEARETFLRIARSRPQPDDPEPFTKARAAARALAAQVGQRIPSLQVEVEGVADGVEVVVQIDGKELPAGTHHHPRKVNPGEKLIQASAPGYIPAGKHVSLTEKQEIVVDLALEPAPVGSPNGSNGSAGDGSSNRPDGAAGDGVSPLVWVGFSIAVAGLGVGAITGGLSLAKTSELEDEHCVNDACPPEVQDDIDEAEALANVSNVGFAVGGVGLVLGLVGIAVSGADGSATQASRSTPTLQVKPALGPGWLGVTGRF